MAPVKDAYMVRARRWLQGWELHIEDVGVTQARTLASGEQQVRDYLETMYDEDASKVRVDIVPEIGALAERAAHAREATEAAARAQQDAAAEVRAAVTDLRDAGLSMADVATILGVSRARASQLATAGVADLLPAPAPDAKTVPARMTVRKADAARKAVGKAGAARKADGKVGTTRKIDGKVGAAIRKGS